MKTLLTGYDKTTHQRMFRVYAEALPMTEKRQEHRQAHFAALDLLGAALAEDFGVYHAVIRREGLGKPALIHDFLHMNLSHCKGLAVAAVGRLPLGVDAESPRTVRDSLLQRVCAPEECAAIRAANDKNLAFTRFWTLKEAYAKYTGKGIGQDFSRLAFTVHDYDDIVFHHPASDEVDFFQIGIDDCFTVSLCFPKSDNIAIDRE